MNHNALQPPGLGFARGRAQIIFTDLIAGELESALTIRVRRVGMRAVGRLNRHARVGYGIASEIQDGPGESPHRNSCVNRDRRSQNNEQDYK